MSLCQRSRLLCRGKGFGDDHDVFDAYFSGARHYIRPIRVERGITEVAVRVDQHARAG